MKKTARITVTEDGPYLVEGGLPLAHQHIVTNAEGESLEWRVPVVSADGSAYEVRNRVTLCRCGASSNKPFCDGSHASIGFDDRK